MKQLNDSIRMSEMFDQLKGKFNEANSRENETLSRQKLIEDNSADNSSLTKADLSASQGLEASNQQLMMDELKELRQLIKTDTKEALAALNLGRQGLKNNPVLEEMQANIKKLTIMSKLSTKGSI